MISDNMEHRTPGRTALSAARRITGDICNDGSAGLPKAVCSADLLPS